MVRIVRGGHVVVRLRWSATASMAPILSAGNDQREFS